MLNKRGFAMELIIFVVVGIIVVLLFAGFIYGFGLINTTLTSGEMDTQYANLTLATSNTFSHLNSGLNQLHLIAAIILIGFVLATLIFAYGSSKNPLWLFVYILVVILVTIFSIYISNSYETLLSGNPLSDTLAGFGISNLILAHLPVWTALIGIFGIVLSIAGAVVGRKLGEN